MDAQFRWSCTRKAWEAPAPITTGQVYAGGAVCTWKAVALICFQFTQRSLESGPAAAGVVVLLVQADAVLGAKVVKAVINVLLTVDTCESSRADAAGKRLCGEGGEGGGGEGLNGVGKQSSLLSDGKENNSKGQGF